MAKMLLTIEINMNQSSGGFVYFARIYCSHKVNQKDGDQLTNNQCTKEGNVKGGYSSQYHKDENHCTALSVHQHKYIHELTKDAVDFDYRQEGPGVTRSEYSKIVPTILAVFGLNQQLF